MKLFVKKLMGAALDGDHKWWLVSLLLGVGCH